MSFKNNIESIDESPAIIAVIEMTSEIKIAQLVANTRGFGRLTFSTYEKKNIPTAKITLKTKMAT